jgi:hypothetical protein
VDAFTQIDAWACNTDLLQFKTPRQVFYGSLNRPALRIYKRDLNRASCTDLLVRTFDLHRLVAAVQLLGYRGYLFLRMPANYKFSTDSKFQNCTPLSELALEPALSIHNRKLKSKFAKDKF